MTSYIIVIIIKTDYKHTVILFFLNITIHFNFNYLFASQYYPSLNFGLDYIKLNVAFIKFNRNYH